MPRYLSLVMVLGLGLALGAGCEEGPEQIYEKLPDNFNPDKYNGLAAESHVCTGEQSFTWSTSGKQEDTSKLCEGDELAKRWAQMVKEPILPTHGAGGLDLRGTPEWAGLTLDDAQQILCQATPYQDGFSYWGDNAELVVFYDTKTRLIDRLYTLPGYEGTISAGTWAIAVNSEVQKDGKAVVNPTSDDTLRQLNIAMLKQFRPEVKNPEQRDCVALGTCYVQDWYTQKRFRFNDLMLDFDMEPETNRVTGIGINLNRNFDFANNPLTFTSTPMPPAGLPPVPMIQTGSGCQLTLGVKWSHVTSKCMGIDPEEKALVRPVWGNEALVADMGGMALYLQRPSLAPDKVLSDTITKADPDDVVSAMYLNIFHDGAIMIDRTALYGDYLDRVTIAVETLLPSIDMTTKFANLEPLGDPSKLSIGTQKIKDCNVTPCEEATLTQRVRKLVEDEITAAGLTVPDKIRFEPNFFVEPLLKELVKTFNDGKEPTASEMYMFPGDESEQVLYISMLRQFNGDRYAIRTAYDNLADQLAYLFFKKGARRAEKALFQDAEETQYDKTQGDGVFRLWNLVNSPRIGLAKMMFPSKTFPETQKALVGIATNPKIDVLVNWHKQDGLSGFGIPIEGKRDKFISTAWYGFSGTVIGASFYADKNGPVKAISSGAFYDKLDFCGVKVGLYDKVTEVIPQLPSDCDYILGYSENGKFLTSMATYVDSPNPAIKMGLRIYITAGRVDGAYYWAEAGQ